MSKTRLISLIILGVLLVFVTYVAGNMLKARNNPTPEPTSFEYTDGIYKGVSDAGMSDGLEVEVTVKQGVIADVEIVEHDEVAVISDKAIANIPKAIVEANSPVVDVVAKATITSKAIMEAVELALEGAR